MHKDEGLKTVINQVAVFSMSPLSFFNLNITRFVKYKIRQYLAEMILIEIRIPQ